MTDWRLRLFILKLPVQQFYGCSIPTDSKEPELLALKEVTLINSRIILGSMQCHVAHRQVSVQTFPVGNPKTTVCAYFQPAHVVFDNRQLLLFLPFKKHIITETNKLNKTKPACKKYLKCSSFLSPTFVAFVVISAFIFQRSPDILALCKSNLNASIFATEFSLYIPLFRNCSSADMHSIDIYVREHLPLAWELSLVSALFLHELLHLLVNSVSYHFPFIIRIPLATFACYIEFLIVEIKPSLYYIHL